MTTSEIHNSNGHKPLMNDGKLLPVSEVAGYLNAHPNSVRRWADMGLLPSYRLGPRGDRRFELGDVVSFLADNRSNGKSNHS